MVEAREIGSGRSIHLEVERQMERERKREGGMRRDDVQCGGVKSKRKSFHVFSVVVLGHSVETAIYVSVCIFSLPVHWNIPMHNTIHSITHRTRSLQVSLTLSQRGWVIVISVSSARASLFFSMVLSGVSNGICPHRIAYTHTPIDHTSERELKRPSATYNETQICKSGREQR